MSVAVLRVARSQPGAPRDPRAVCRSCDAQAALLVAGLYACCHVGPASPSRLVLARPLRPRPRCQDVAQQVGAGGAGLKLSRWRRGEVMMGGSGGRPGRARGAGRRAVMRQRARCRKPVEREARAESSAVLRGGAPLTQREMKRRALGATREGHAGSRGDKVQANKRDFGSSLRTPVRVAVSLGYQDETRAIPTVSILRCIARDTKRRDSAVVTRLTVRPQIPPRPRVRASQSATRGSPS
eukprot:766047-Hanusia_phi.AAC.1